MFTTTSRRAAASSVLLVAIASVARTFAQTTIRVSVDSSGNQANAACYSATISADGHVVVFLSAATNLVGGDTNGAIDVFVRDLPSATTTRASVSSSGTQADADSGGTHGPSLSTDGRFVVFVSGADNLVLGDTNTDGDVFVRDRQLGTTTRVSVDSGGNQGNDPCNHATISGDGRFVAFDSMSNNLVLGDTNGFVDVFVHDRQTATTTRVSVATGGGQGNGPSEEPFISSDGRFVVFTSRAQTLAGIDTNPWPDCFVHDRQTGVTSCVSVNASGVQGNSLHVARGISADGRFVGFYSESTNLVPGDTNGKTDPFVHDRQSGATFRVDVAANGDQGDNGGYGAAFSADGRFVFFTSASTNLVEADTNGFNDAFVWDSQISAARIVSRAFDGSQANFPSDGWSGSADGRVLTFSSNANNLVPGDTNATTDVFVRDWWFPCYRDSDVDAYGDPSMPTALSVTCTTGYVENDDDCDDGNASVHPGALELCNGVDDDCDTVVDDLVHTYCTSSKSENSCVPAISGVGTPSASSGSGFDIVVSLVDGQRSSQIFYGLSATSLPWAILSTSWRCVASPVQRTGIQNTGGNAGACDGEIRRDFDQWIAANPTALGSPFASGQVFYAQGWFRDPGAPKGTNLSDALMFVLCP